MIGKYCCSVVNNDGLVSWHLYLNIVSKLQLRVLGHTPFWCICPECFLSNPTFLNQQNPREPRLHFAHFRFLCLLWICLNGRILTEATKEVEIWNFLRLCITGSKLAWLHNKATNYFSIMCKIFELIILLHCKVLWNNLCTL